MAKVEVDAAIPDSPTSEFFEIELLHEQERQGTSKRSVMTDYGQRLLDVITKFVESRGQAGLTDLSLIHI